MTALFRIKKDRFFIGLFFIFIFYSVSKSALELKACGITAKTERPLRKFGFAAKKTAPKKERQKCGLEIIVLFRCFPFLFAACRNFRA